MRRFALASLLLFTACDHDEDATYKSIFPKDDVLGREVLGRVRRGQELTNGAIVRLGATTPAYHGDLSFRPAASVVTDEFGFFRFGQGPLRYDLTMRLDSDVVIFRGLVFRGYDAPFGDPVPPRGFVSKISVVLNPPPVHPVAFFATGDRVWDVTGDLANGLFVSTQDFTSTVTLRAVEYDGTLEHPVSSGQVDVAISNAVATTPATLTLAPITKDDRDVLVDAEEPPGSVLDPITWGLTFGSNYQIRTIGQVARGTHLRFTLVPGARYTYRTRATKSGAISDSGSIDIPVFDPKVTAKLYPFLTPEPPADGQFVAHTVGVREHAFLAPPGSTTVRIVSVDDAVSIPDVTSTGAPAPKGTVSWVVRAWPTATTIDNFQGPDARTAPPMLVSAPQTIQLP